ncbi:MAG: TRAP transporter small permease subunit [Bacteroidota bacterium]
MSKIIQLFTRLLQWGTLLSATGFIASTLVQIYARFFMASAPSWTEEVARFFFVYAMSFAAGLALKDHYYVHLDVLYNRLNDRQKARLRLGISLCTLTLFLLLTIYSWQFVDLGIPEKSPSLGFSMALAFTSIFIMGASVSVYALLDVANFFKKTA